MAYKLKLTVSEVRDMPHDEFMRWYVWLGRLAQQQELASKQGS